MGIGEKFFAERAIRYWNELLREVAESLSPEAIKERLTAHDTQCHGLIDTVLFSHKLDSIISEVFCNLN